MPQNYINPSLVTPKKTRIDIYKVTDSIKRSTCLRMWPREKESNLQFRVQSPTCYQLHHPGNMVAVAGVEPASLDYQSSALALSYTAVGWSDGAQTRTSRLKRPLLCHSSSGPRHWLWRKDSNLRCRINNPMPYQLGYATKKLDAATRVELASTRLQDERSEAD